MVHLFCSFTQAGRKNFFSDTQGGNGMICIRKVSDEILILVNYAFMIPELIKGVLTNAGFSPNYVT